MVCAESRYIAVNGSIEVEVIDDFIMVAFCWLAIVIIRVIVQVGELRDGDTITLRDRI